MFTSSKVSLAAAVLSLALLASAPSSRAGVINYEGFLFNATASFGSVSAAGLFDSPESALSDYWTFFGNQGDIATIIVNRLETDLDPALWIFEGNFADDTAFVGSIDSTDPGFLDFADDEIPNPGPFGDPEATFELTLPATGQYTAIVTNFLSGPDAGGDGFFDYQITARNIVNVPEPTSLTIFGVGAVWMVGFRSRRKRGDR